MTELEQKLLAALRGLACSARTFRNVAKAEQDWTPLDDEALEFAFRAIEEAEAQLPAAPLLRWIEAPA